MPARFECANRGGTLITGYPGRLARAFATGWPRARTAGRAQFDITDKSATLRAIDQMRPAIVINCAALTGMLRCEADPDLAWSVNVWGVRNLAEACRSAGATLVHFSSDYALDPLNEYARTKRASEAFADVTIRAKIYDDSHWCWRSLRQGASVKMLTTEYLNPISTIATVTLLEQILALEIRGTIAIGTLERLTFWEVGRIWAKVLGADPDAVEAVESIETPMPRLREMFLDTAPLQSKGIRVPTLEEDAARVRDWLERP